MDEAEKYCTEKLPESAALAKNEARIKAPRDIRSLMQQIVDFKNKHKLYAPIVGISYKDKESDIVDIRDNEDLELCLSHMLADST